MTGGMVVRRLFRKLRSVEPVYGQITLTALAAAALFVLFVRHYQPISQPGIAWWVLAAVVLITERHPVALEFRRSSHSFSLTDVPMTLALVFTSGTHTFTAITTGTVVALLFRRLPVVKLAFNIAQFAFVTCVLTVLVHVAADAAGGFDWEAWAAVLIATQIGGVLTIA